MTAIKTTLLAIKDFLLRERTLGKSKPSPVRRRRNRQRGVALIAVMIAIAITLVIANEFGTSTTGDLMAAANYRDQMRAHFLARSALNLSELLIRVQQRTDNVQQLRDMGLRFTDFADQILMAFCGNPEQVQAVIGFSGSEAKSLGVEIGTCGIVGQQITTEDDKINLNCANGSVTGGPEDALKAMLDALIYFPAYDPVFEEADAEGYRRDRATQVAAILDYVDANTQRIHEFGTTEEYGYESLKDPYRAKNNYIDTVGEIRMARGVDDRFWTLFGPAFTVYGSCKINVTSVSNPQLIAAILYLSAKNTNDPMLQDPMKLFALANLVAKAKSFGMSFNKLAEFADFVKDPAAQLGLLTGKGGFAGVMANTGLAQLPGMTNGQKLGLELDMTKLQKITGTGPRRTYRVEAFGEIERKQRAANGGSLFPSIRSVITGVWDTKVVPQNVRKPPVPKGAWVLMRED